MKVFKFFGCLRSGGAWLLTLSAFWLHFCGLNPGFNHVTIALTLLMCIVRRCLREVVSLLCVGR